MKICQFSSKIFAGYETAFLSIRKNKIMKSNKILSYAEYRQRIKELKNPEAMASFIKELLVPALSEAAKNVGIEEQEDNNEIVEVVDRHPATVTKEGFTSCLRIRKN